MKLIINVIRNHSFRLLLAAVLLGSMSSCVYRGFGRYAADGSGDVIRQGYVLYAPWPFPFRHYERCSPKADGAMECREIEVSFD